MVYEFLNRKQWNQGSLKNASVPEAAEDTAIYELIETKQLLDEQEVFDEISEIDPHEFPVQEVSAEVEEVAEQDENTSEVPITEERVADEESVLAEDSFVEEEVAVEENSHAENLVEEEDVPEQHFDEEEDEKSVEELIEEDIDNEDILHQDQENNAASQPKAVTIEIETVENTVEEEEVPVDEDEVAQDITNVEVAEPVETKSIPVIETQEDAFVLENIMSTDFFAFEQSFSSPVAVAPEIEEAAEPAADHEYLPSDAKETAVEQKIAQPEVIAEEVLNSDSSEVTNYHDEKLPYTFLWWLAKTRKEYQTIFQPYVSLKKTNPNELQQQYVEHIFHIQSPFNPEEILNNVPETKGDSKDLEIIDNFIKRDPHISPPRPEQIDTENKARKSAEDQNDVVSETLAKIYIEQMLYHKAIDTYDKLS
ncbi:MAG: hypothetical protein EOO88_29780, partial [Pedobacter sp.]